VFASMMAARSVQSLLTVSHRSSPTLISGSSPEELTTSAGPGTHAETSKHVQISSKNVIPLFIFPPGKIVVLSQYL
jgi:hypothetical protein